MAGSSHSGLAGLYMLGMALLQSIREWWEFQHFPKATDSRPSPNGGQIHAVMTVQGDRESVYDCYVQNLPVVTLKRDIKEQWHFARIFSSLWA